MRLLLPNSALSKFRVRPGTGLFSRIPTSVLSFAYTLYAGSMSAGGKGSGCHGNNCGRPKKNIHQVTKEHGWSEAGKEKEGYKTWTTYNHPTLGTLKVSPYGMQYFDKGGKQVTFLKAVPGQNMAQKLKDYLYKLQGPLEDQPESKVSQPSTPPSTPEPAPKAVTSPETAKTTISDEAKTSNKLPEYVKTTKSGNVYVWDKQEKVYHKLDDPEKQLTPVAIGSLLKKGYAVEWKPETTPAEPAVSEKKPPPGMATLYKSHSLEYVFNHETGNYDQYSSITGNKTENPPYSADDVKELVDLEVAKPVKGATVTPVEEDKFTQKLSLEPDADAFLEDNKQEIEKTLQQDVIKPPDGLAVSYKNTQTGHIYDFNPATGQWKSSSGKDIDKGYIQYALKNNKLKETGAPPKAAAPDISKSADPPAGMAKKYVATGTGAVATWNSETGKYDAPSGKWTPDQFQKIIKMGSFVPADPPPSEKPFDYNKAGQKIEHPDGMHKEYVNSDSGSTFKFNPETGEYDKTLKHGTPTGAFTPAEMRKVIEYTPQVIPVESAVKTAPSAAPAVYNPPLGMKGFYLNSKLPNQKYIWNQETKKYDKYIGYSLKQSLEPSFVKQLQKKGNVHESNAPNWLKNQGGAKYGAQPVAPAVPSTPAPTVTAPPKPVAPSVPIEVHEPKLPKASADFDYVGNAAHLGGAHEKYMLRDKQGNEWMFKPATTLGGQKSDLTAYAEEAANKIHKLIRPEVPIDVKSVTVNIPGKGEVFGSAQKMVPKNLQSEYIDFKGRDFSKTPLSQNEIRALQKEQVVDWLTSNHDSHAGQFVRLKDSGVRAVGVDKAQAFKFLGQDKLSADYHPNKMEQPPFYNFMWQQVKAGKASFDPEAILDQIKRVEAISDSDYKKMLTDYAGARFKGDQKGANAFLDQAVARKNSVRKDFEAFYSDVIGKKFMFEPKPEPGSVVQVDETSTYSGPNPTPKFTQKLPSSKYEMRNEAIQLLQQYGGAKATKTNLADSVDAWKLKLGYGDHTKEKLVAAAKGAGVYAELAAARGLTPDDLLTVQQAFKSWSGSSGSGSAPGKIRDAAQQIVMDKCCHDKFAQALELEHAVTYAKLSEMHPEGVVKLSRTVGGPLATALSQASKMAETIHIKLLGAEGWSDNESFGDMGARIYMDVPLENIMTSWKTNHDAWSAHIGEHEYVIAFPNASKDFKVHQVKAKKGMYGSIFVAKSAKFCSASPAWIKEMAAAAKKNKIVIDLTTALEMNWKTMVRMGFYKKGGGEVFELIPVEESDE
jgi:hypothetical protein